MNSIKRLSIIIPVWGEYCDILINHTFKSFLLPENIKYLNKDRDVIRILTTPLHSQFFNNSDIVNILRKDVKIEIIECNLDFKISKYKIASSLHEKGLNIKPLYNYVMPHHPDDCIVDGTIKYILENINKYKLIMTMSLRVNLLDFINSVDNFNYNLDYDTILGIVIKNLHAIPKRLMKNSKYFNNEWPSHIYWANKHNFIGRCLHMHPLAINISDIKKYMNISGTVDDKNFLSLITENDYSNIKIINDKLHIISLTENDNNKYKRDIFNLFNFIKFCAINAGKVHLHLFDNKINFKSLKELEFSDDIGQEAIFFKKFQKSIFIYRLFVIYYLIRNKLFKYLNYKNYINKIKKYL